jgi:hypothetical protein
MKNKHTVGKWWVGDSYEGQREGYVGIHSPEWAALAEVCIEVDNEKSEEGWDNAYLMAASIELYDACRAFVKAMKTDGNKGLNKAYQLAQEAIAKAKSRGNII